MEIDLDLYISKAREMSEKGTFQWWVDLETLLKELKEARETLMELKESAHDHP